MKPRHPSTAPQSISNHSIPARRSRPSVRTNQGVRIERNVTIHRTPGELFAFWRNFENLPLVLKHVESVECMDDLRSRWRIRWPRKDVTEWESQVINEHPNELIAWRTLEGSDVQHAGSIRFTPLAGGRATEVKLSLEYDGGSGLKQFLSKLMGRNPERQIADDLDHFKELMEAGEISRLQR
jgi:uncharacterized membrane protein